MNKLQGLLTLAVAFALTTGLQADDTKKEGKAVAVEGTVEDAPKEAKKGNKKKGEKKADAKKGEKKKGEAKGNKGKGRQARIQALNLPKTIELTEEQKVEVAKLKKEYTPKFAELNKKMREVIPADVRKARAAAGKEARAAGKKGKELQAAINAASPISADVKEATEETRAALQALNKEVRGKVMELLTEEQKASLPKRKQGKGKKKSKAEAAEAKEG